MNDFRIELDHMLNRLAVYAAAGLSVGLILLAAAMLLWFVVSGWAFLIGI